MFIETFAYALLFAFILGFFFARPALTIILAGIFFVITLTFGVTDDVFDPPKQHAIELTELAFEHYPFLDNIRVGWELAS